MKGLACITALPALILAASISAILVAQVLPLQVDKIVNMGPEINTPFDDFAPSFTADGNTMVFNSKRLGEPYQNIYICRREGGRWTEARAIAEINSPYNDETPFITPDGAFIFFASDRDGSLECRPTLPAGSGYPMIFTSARTSKADGSAQYASRER